MAGLASNAGVVPVFLTAPSSHEIGREPEKLDTRWLRDLNDLVPLHREYIGVVRRVGARENAVLCDLAARFDALPREQVRTRYFRADGIHPLPAGDQKIAEFLYGCFDAEPRLRALWR